MVIIFEILFWLLLGSLIVSYIIYPLIISLIKPKQRGNAWNMSPTSKVHLLIACYNEEAVIEDKIRNSMRIDYPGEFVVYVIIDKSSDRTSEIAHALAKEYSNLIVMDKGYRRGKNDSINYFYKNVRPDNDDILFFTDANTFYHTDSFLKLYEKLQSGAAVVGGSMRYIDQDSNSAKSEGLYWRYEEWIRRNESRFGRAITMNGGNMAMIAKYFKELPLFVPNDFHIPINLVSKYQTSFAAESIGDEKAIQNENEELNRKKRMANRQMSAILIGWSEFSLITKIQLIFHKIIRWLAIPLFLLATVCKLIIDIQNGDISLLFYSMCFLWGTVLMCVLLTRYFNVKLPVVSTLSYAYEVHYYGGIGAIKAFRGIKVSQWGKAASNRV